MEQTRILWRGGLPPLGCEAAPNQATTLCQESRVYRFDDCFAAERGQAPSPQKHIALRPTSKFR
ncbi:hypothetical protein CRX42_02295 [Pseudomonas jessenii]|uniref:Uncharacterized protein n=1 Tax=Pseudomonas jessenii TaxID=77298 RepID=A0A2W0F6R8_PSEJE|nr:hypothetical protein CRX42_02295 [Pseudomonas jessenii]